MKYIIVLYMCSFSTSPPQCLPGQILGIEFNDYTDCILEGYLQSHQTLKRLEKEEINKNKLAIKFDCKEIKVENI